MRLRELHVQKFRNHTHTDAVFGPGINAILGENGQGKTNLLEAISCLCLTRSFFGSPDHVVLQIGETQFEVYGELETDSGLRYQVATVYDGESAEKEFRINKAKINRSSEVVGQFPLVVLSPESNAITSGGPADRRRFLDFVIAQASKMYLGDLLEYRRVLRQRNKLLLDNKVDRRNIDEQLEPWDQELTERGARITRRREEFIRELHPIVCEAYRTVAGGDEEPELRYQASVAYDSAANEEELQRIFRLALGRKKAEEQRLGLTLVGPHRDEVEFGINGLGMRSHASQGQHKTFLVALKTAEFLYLKNKRSESPVLLLDDVFTELDSKRAASLLAMAESLGQIFITATSEGAFPAGRSWPGEHRKFFVTKGSIEQATPSSVAN